MSNVKIEVCKNNRRRHAMTHEVLTKIREEFSGLESQIDYVEMKCGGICVVCERTPYVVVDKKLIPGVTQEQFHQGVKSHLNRRLAEHSTV